MRLAFVVAEPRDQRHTFGTIYLAQAALRRGHDVGFVGIDDLSLLPDDEVVATITRPRRSAASNEELCALLANDADRQEESLDRFDVVFLRYNPGGTLRGNAAVDFGWRLQLRGTLVVNDPDGIRRAASRAYLSGLPGNLRARTLVTRDAARVKSFLAALDTPAIMKPLGRRPEGEEENVVFTLARGQVDNLDQMISVIKQRGYVMVQETLSGIVAGEKRLLLLRGEPMKTGKQVAVYRRPPESAPGRGREGPRRTCEFGAAEARIVEALRPRLETDGLYFVAVDIVGGKVTELNVHTPGGFHANLELHGLDIGEVVVRDLEQRVMQRRARPARVR
jgi:glutathione synthase